MASPDIYSSTPLPTDNKSIRVLILKTAKKYEDPLVSTLKVVSLACRTQDCLPSYHALSYVWGDYHSPKDTLHCGTAVFPITRNCRDALRAIRSLYDAQVEIWVDAICINQENIMEKTQQIQIMSDIYTWASIVDIWLGEGNYDVWQAMFWLELVAKTNYLPLERIRSYRDPDLPHLIPFPGETLSTALCRIMCMYRMEPDHFEQCINRFLGQEWFLRAWTFQEALLSSHSIFICGHRLLSWDTMAQGMAVLRYKFRNDTRDHIGRYPTIHYPLLRSVGADNIDKLTTTDPLRVPSKLRAFDRLVQIWMNLKRPRLGIHSSGHTSRPSRHTSRPSRHTSRPSRHTSRPSRHISRPTLEESMHDIQRAQVCHLRNNDLDERLDSHVQRKVSHALLLLSFGICIATLLLIVLLGVGVGYTIALLLLFILAKTLSMKLGGSHIGLELHERIGFRNFLYPRSEAMEDAKTGVVECIVHNLRQRKATRPHDKAYAMYGILHMMGLQLAKLDYGKSIYQTYHELMLDLLRWSPAALIVLLDVGKSCDEVNAAAPSWVPDWSMLPPEPTFSDDYFQSSSYRIMDATPGSQPAFTLSSDHRVLKTRGHKQDVIVFSTERFASMSYSSLLQQHVGTRLLFNEAVSIFASWIQIVRSTTRPTYLPAFRSYIDVEVIVDDDEDGGRTEDVYFEWISDHVGRNEAMDSIDIFLVLTRSSKVLENDPALLELRKIINCFPTTVSLPLSLQDLQTTTQNLVSNETILAAFIDIVNGLALNHRRLFTTHSGYLGCGSYDITNGDVIALVAGVPAPLTLRQVSTEDDRPGAAFLQYQVMCAAFVLGLMDGTAWEDNNTENLELI